MRDPRKRNIRIYRIQILFILLLCSSSILAQEQATSENKKEESSLTLLQNFNKYNKSNLGFYHTGMQWDNYNYYNAFMGSFCKVEHESSKASGMAIRMRLGNVNTVNDLEMKLPAWRMLMLEESRY